MITFKDDSDDDILHNNSDQKFMKQILFVLY